jgi:hypothetical protein
MGGTDIKVVSQKIGRCSTGDSFTVSVNMRAQDTWFLLLISVIMAHLRYVGDTCTFRGAYLLQICIKISVFF